jgi:hypothetical protein
VEQELDVGVWKLSDAFCEDSAVDGDDLRDVGDGVAWEPGACCGEQYVARCGFPAEIARERDDDDGGEAARVECVSLNDYDRPT